MHWDHPIPALQITYETGTPHTHCQTCLIEPQFDCWGTDIIKARIINDTNDALTTEPGGQHFDVVTLPNDLWTMILKHLEPHDVVATVCSNTSLYHFAEHEHIEIERVLRKALRKIRWAQNMISMHVYYCSLVRRIRDVSEIVTVREVARMARRKHERGLRRAVRRVDLNNWIVPPHMSACTALKVGKSRERHPDWHPTPVVWPHSNVYSDYAY